MKPSEIFEGENSGLKKALITTSGMYNIENDADNGVVHIGGESKEEIKAEDKWHDEQMTYTDKILAEFREKFLKQKICKACLREACDYSTTGCPWYQITLTLNKDTKDWEDTGEQMLAFLSTSIQQAIAEDRERVVGLYGTPICDNLHHKKNQRHTGGEICPVVQEINNLVNKI